MRKFILLFIAMFGLWGVESSAQPAQVLLIRHAEKESGSKDISAQGWQRAQALPQLFKRSDFTQYGLPVALYAMQPTSDGKSKRAVETLTYVAQYLNIPINSDFDKDDVQGLVGAINNKSEYQGHSVLICWEHKILGQIAAAFGVADVPEWSDDVYDRVWVINFASDGTATLTDLPQKLLPGDSK